MEMDPITTAMASALIAGVMQGTAAVGKQLIVDAYTTLRDAIWTKCGPQSDVAEAIERAEQEPDRESRQLALAEEIAEADLARDAELVQLAKALQAALAETKAGKQALAKYQVAAQQIVIVGDGTTVEGGIHFGTVRKDG